MFGFLKSKLIDPSAIANTIFAVATDKALLASCYRMFAPSPDDRKRANFGAVLFVYCCAHYWSASKNDGRIVAACGNAAELIPDKLKDPDRFVRVGDYLVSKFEVSALLSLLETQFQQRIPIPDEALADSEDVGAALHTAVQSHEIQLATLAKAALLLRQQQFADTIERTAHLKDMDVTFMLLAANFDEQVTGITSLHTADDPQLATEQQMRGIRGSAILYDYFRRIVTRLDTL